MATKKFVNKVEDCVDEALAGLVAVNPGLRLLEGHRVIVRADIEEVKQKGQVTLLCGGGSGHEPAHGGFVGAGMLSAVVAGAVFASPPASSILAGIRKVGKGNKGGVLVIVKNYTGDRLNFGFAIEKARSEGIKAEMVIVGEDCALASHDKSAGRRGLTGGIFVHKIAGAMAEKGASLEMIVEAVKQATHDMGTIGVSLSPCSLPGAKPSFTLGENEMELGLGIHGEPGVKRIEMQTAKECVATMLSHMTHKDNASHLPLEPGQQVALIVNNLGGTSVLELNIIVKEAIDWLNRFGLSVARAFCGSFMTSLEMAGVSLTIMILNEARKDYLDSPTEAPAWTRPLMPSGMTDRETPSRMAAEISDVTDTSTASGERISDEAGAKVIKAIEAACHALIKSEIVLNELDGKCGDGDCGATFKVGAQAILDALSGPDKLPVCYPGRLLLTLADITGNKMGGSSGALYSIFLAAAAKRFSENTEPNHWSAALEAGLEALTKYGRAEPGDRTMIDALHPASQSLKKAGDVTERNMKSVLQQVVKASEEGAQATATMSARAGRASYVSKDHQTAPDAGATAVSIWLKAAVESLD